MQKKKKLLGSLFSGEPNCPVSLPQQSSGNCKTLREKELEAQRGIYQLAPRPPLPMPLVNMSIPRLVAHLSQDAFAKEQFGGYVGMLKKNKGFAAQWRARYPDEITEFQEYENMFKEFRNTLASNVSEVGETFLLSTLLLSVQAKLGPALDIGDITRRREDMNFIFEW